MKVNNLKSMKIVGKCVLGVIGFGATALTISNAKVKYYDKWKSSQEDDVYYELRDALDNIMPYIEKENFINNISKIANKLTVPSIFDKYKILAPDFIKNDEALIKCLNTLEKHKKQLSRKHSEYPVEKELIQFSSLYQRILISLRELYNSNYPNNLQQLSEYNQQEIRQTVFAALDIFNKNYDEKEHM